jgi:hypothetical protein
MTGAGTTEEISAPDDMRSLIERAVRRKSDELLKAFSDILTGRPATLTENAAALYEPEIAGGRAVPAIEVGAVMPGHFEVLAYPTVHNAKRIESIPAAADAVRQSEVRLRGWYFPHTDNQNAGPFSGGFQSSAVSTAWSRKLDGYRIYQSGLFLWKGAYYEDLEDKRSGTGRPVLSFVSTIFSFTEFLLFLSRLYEHIAPEATVRIVITRHGCNGRELVSLDGSTWLWGGHIAHEDIIRQEREVQGAELRASHLAIAAEMVKHVFHVFGWLNVHDDVITSHQQRLLKHV